MTRRFAQRKAPSGTIISFEYEYDHGDGDFPVIDLQVEAEVEAPESDTGKLRPWISRLSLRDAFGEEVPEASLPKRTLEFIEEKAIDIFMDR